MYLVNFYTTAPHLVARDGADQVYALCRDDLLEKLIEQTFRTDRGAIDRRDERDRIVISTPERMWFFQKLSEGMPPEAFPYFYGQDGKAAEPIFKEIVTEREAYPKLSEKYLSGKVCAREISADEFFGKLYTATGRIGEGPYPRLRRDQEAVEAHSAAVLAGEGDE